jgi:hypothetical protein
MRYLLYAFNPLSLHESCKDCLEKQGLRSVETPLATYKARYPRGLLLKKEDASLEPTFLNLREDK